MRRYLLLILIFLGALVAIPLAITADQQGPSVSPKSGHPVAPITPATAQGGLVWPDAEPHNRFAREIGRQPGTGGSNGAIPGKYLARIPGGPQNLFVKPAAAAWNTMNLESRRSLGVSILSGDSDATYRTAARQVYWSYFWCGTPYGCANAAVPRHSNHGWARADDLRDCNRSKDAINRVGGKYGWVKVEAPGECWHYTFVAGGFPRPDPGFDYNYPRLCHGSGGSGQGPWVSYMQTRLRRHGIATSSTGGYMTVGNVRSVQAFQHKSRIHVHACTDTKTWSLLSR